MGHDVAIWSEDDGVVDKTYISGNFSKYEGGIHVMHGHTGKTIAKIARKTIIKLLAEDIPMGMPDADNRDWWFAMRDGKPMPEAEKKGIFMCIMNVFFTLALTYPDCRFYSDQTSEVIPFDEDGYHSDGEYREDNELDSD